MELVRGVHNGVQPTVDRRGILGDAAADTEVVDALRRVDVQVYAVVEVLHGVHALQLDGAPVVLLRLRSALATKVHQIANNKHNRAGEAVASIGQSANPAIHCDIRSVKQPNKPCVWAAL